MKLPRSTRRCEGIVWLEVLVITVVLMLVAIVLIPYLRGGGPAKGVSCMTHQKEIALGFTMWKIDNGEKYSWQVPATNHGVMEASAGGDAAVGFQTLQGYVEMPPAFVCPTEPARAAATNVASVTAQNISYFINLDASVSATNGWANILTGDRHLMVDGTPIRPGLFTYTNNMSMGWTTELHRLAAVPMGVFSFCDGHCEVANNTTIKTDFQRQDVASARLAIP